VDCERTDRKLDARCNFPLNKGLQRQLKARRKGLYGINRRINGKKNRKIE
jgi:hypothetical protein